MNSHPISPRVIARLLRVTVTAWAPAMASCRRGDDTHRGFSGLGVGFTIEAAVLALGLDTPIKCETIAARWEAQFAPCTNMQG
jgi:hypothetical protein